MLSAPPATASAPAASPYAAAAAATANQVCSFTSSLFTVPTLLVQEQNTLFYLSSSFYTDQTSLLAVS